MCFYLLQQNLKIWMEEIRINSIYNNLPMNEPDHLDKVWRIVITIWAAGGEYQVPTTKFKVFEVRDLYFVLCSLIIFMTQNMRLSFRNGKKKKEEKKRIRLQVSDLDTKSNAACTNKTKLNETYQWNFSSFLPWGQIYVLFYILHAWISC